MANVHPLKAYRASARLTQRQLAKLLGVERETVARWETGARQIGLESIPRIMKQTGISPVQLRPDLALLVAAAK